MGDPSARPIAMETRTLPDWPADHLTEQEIAFYKHITESGGIVHARVDARAAIGFGYPAVTEYLGFDSERALDYLHFRERQNLVRGVFLDRVNLCPGCHHALVNFREVCPRCVHPGIGFESVIHHFRCAHVGREQEFDRGLGLVCPKCGQNLRSIGKDFERPSDLFFCHRCENLFPEPGVEGLCLHCSHRFTQEERIVRDVLEFQVTAMVVPAMEGRPWQTELPSSVLDELPNVMSEDFLLAMLDLEIRRALRYERPLSVVALSGELLRAVDPRSRSFETTRRLYELVSALEKVRRNTDIVGRLKTGELLFVLTETAMSNTDPMIARVGATLKETMHADVAAGAAALRLDSPVGPRELIGEALAVQRPVET